MLDNISKFPMRIQIGDKYISRTDPTFFIAEIGNNHNGDYYLAKRTIEQAAKAGADAVKFQKRSIPDTFAKELLEREQVKDRVFGKTYQEYRQKLELSHDDYVNLKKHAEELGLIFFSTPFDFKSVDFLEDIGIQAYKIASFDVTNWPLLKYIAQKNKPIFLSLGMSTLKEADRAVQLILKYNQQLIIKHCVTIYPPADENLNLATIQYLIKRYYPLPVGYSGHEKDILPSLIAATLGAKTIERHFTLDKNLPGPDHNTVSIEPDEFKQMVDQTRRMEISLGIPTKKLWQEEMRVRGKHGKSLVSTQDIPAGQIITPSMLVPKSPGYGLPPYMLKKVIGRKVKSDIPADTVITDDVIDW